MSASTATRQSHRPSVLPIGNDETFTRRPGHRVSTWQSAHALRSRSPTRFRVPDGSDATVQHPGLGRKSLHELDGEPLDRMPKNTIWPSEGADHRRGDQSTSSTEATRSASVDITPSKGPRVN